MARSIDEGLLTQAFNILCDLHDNLPEDWQINLEFRKGELSVDLINPDGEVVDMDETDYEAPGEVYPIIRMLINRISHARVSDGLQPLDSDL